MNLPAHHDVIRTITPSVRRTHLQFAEEDLIIPNGPRKGQRFSAAFMPFSRDVLNEFSLGRFTDFYGSGPVQAGKTTIFYVIPALYHLFEMEEDVILGAPVLEMSQSAYRERLLPAIRSSRYRRLIPRSGHGARGGKAMSIQFLNGASIRFIGARGGDEQIASYTSRIVVATELDKMDEPGKGSRETDPVTKLKARTKSFGAAARFYGECTMSVKTGRIYREVVGIGSDSRVFLQCQYCVGWFFPERSGLVGWQEVTDVLEARTKAAFQCPLCLKQWTEFDRQKSMKNPRVVARGQSVTKEGVVEGDLPRTLTYGFRWNSMASPLLTMADIAKDEWEAEHSGDLSAQKGVTQYVWAEPYEEEIMDLHRPEVATILGKIVGHERGSIPPGTVKVTVGVDVGSYVIWWAATAWQADGQGHVFDFSGLDVPLMDGKKSPLAVLSALRAFRDNVLLPGWAGRGPDRVLIDSGYEQDAVYQFVLESGQGRFMACKGFGTSSRNGFWRTPAASVPSPTRQVGNEWRVTLQPTGIRLVDVHSDHWKAKVHDGFAAPQGASGSLTLFYGQPTDPQLRIFARQIVAEQRELRSTGTKEAKVVWVVRQRQNHYLDTMAYARAAADLEGVKETVTTPAPGVKRNPPPRRPIPMRRSIRTRY